MMKQAKKQRIQKAVRLYYGPQDLTQQEVANELDVTRRTVANYLDTDYAEDCKRPYSDREEYKLRKALEEKQQEVEELTDEVVRRIMEHPEADPKDMLRAVKEMRDTTMGLVEFFDKLGIVRAEPERHEVQHEAGDVVDRLRKLSAEDLDEDDGEDG